MATKATVSQKLKYSRECVVSFNQESNLASADLVVDGVSFRDLKLKRDVHQEDELKTSPIALNSTYGVSCPYKVNEQAPSGLKVYAGALSEGLAGFRSLVTGAVDAPLVTGALDAPPKQVNLLEGILQCCLARQMQVLKMST